MKVRNFVVVFLLYFIFYPHLATAGICESKYNACMKNCEYKYNSGYVGGGHYPQRYKGYISKCKAIYNACKAEEKAEGTYEHFVKPKWHSAKEWLRGSLIANFAIKG